VHKGGLSVESLKLVSFSFILGKRIIWSRKRLILGLMSRSW